MRRGYGRAGVARQNVHCGAVAEFDVAVSKELKGRRLGLRSNTLRRQLRLGIIPFTADDHWSTPRRVAGGGASKTLQMSDLRHPSKIFWKREEQLSPAGALAPAASTFTF